MLSPRWSRCSSATLLGKPTAKSAEFGAVIARTADRSPRCQRFFLWQAGTRHLAETHALSNQVRGFTVVMVVHDDGQVVGYYGLAPTTVVRSSLPRAIRTGQSPDPVPCLLLGQLAVDHRWNGRGIGSGLLRHALARAISGAALVGGRACWSKPSTPDAADFWQRRGFLASRDDRLTLFRSIADIAASLAASKR